MEDQFEKKLKALLPYIIITGAVYLLLPLFMKTGVTAATYIILVGAFPLTAVGCGAHYALVRKQRDLLVCFLAPVFYALTALLYGMWRDSALTVIIYIAAYFLCGWLGMLICDILCPSKKDAQEPSGSPAKRPLIKPSLRPRRVNVGEQPAPEAELPITEDPEQDDSLNAATTNDDIEEILNAIHSRKSQ